MYMLCVQMYSINPTRENIDDIFQVELFLFNTCKKYAQYKCFKNLLTAFEFVSDNGFLNTIVFTVTN